MGKSLRRFGAELEFECSWDTLKKTCTKIIENVYGIKKYYCQQGSFQSDFKLDKWHIKEDTMGGISELTTPVSTKKDLKNIRSVVQKIQNSNLNPSERCGFHVHLDIKDIDQYHFMSCWMIYEKAIFSCFPLDRRKSSYCGKIIDSPRESKSYVSHLLEEKTLRSDHSHAISLAHYNDRKTVEVRIAEGTDDPNFVVSWISFLLIFCDYVKTMNPSLTTANKCNSKSFEDMIIELPINQSVLDFMKERYKKYGKLPYWVY